jgi:hypothetical protein
MDIGCNTFTYVNYFRIGLYYSREDGKKSGGTKSGERGAIIGSLSGIIFVNPLILIFGSFIGALIGEIINDSKDMKKAIKSAFSSFIGFLFGTGIKAFLTLSFLLILILNLLFGWF